MKKTLSIVLALMMVLSVSFVAAGCGGGGSDEGSSDAEAKILHFGSTQGTTHAWYEAAQTFATNLEQNSNGALKAQIDFGGIWGSDKDHAEAVQNGTLDMYIGSTVGFDAVVSSIGFVNLPYLVTNYDEVDKYIYNGWMGEKIVELADAEGLKVLGITDCDFRWISNSKRSIESAADMKGLKMRTPGTTMFLKFFEELGTIPSSLPFTELASALQQGVYDGQDNGPTLSYPNGLHQFNKYWTKSNHSFASAVIAVNPAMFDSLSAEQQEALQKTVDQYVEDCKTLLREDVTEMSQKMSDEGCEVIDVTDQLDKDMREAAKAVWANDEATNTFDKDAMDRIRKNGGAQ